MVVHCSLTWNPTRTPPNQVSYLKGSSMESFILGPTPKIDFSCSAATAHLQCLRENKSAPITSENNSISSDGIHYRILAVLNAQGPLFIGWGSNGRLQWNIRVSSGRWTRAVRTDNCATRIYEIFAENLSCLRTASGRWGTVVRTIARPLQVISI